MEKYISKFITYLSSISHIELSNITKNNKPSIIYYSYYQKLIQYFSNDEQTIFLNFDILSNLLLESNLNTNERVNIILYIINKNIKLNIISSNNTFILLSDILSYHFKSINIIDLLDLLNDPHFNTFMSSPDEYLDKETATIRNEINEFISTHNHSNYPNIHKLINDTLSTNPIDIPKLISYLKELNINDTVLSNITYILNKRYPKKEDIIPPKKQIPTQNKISIKEYNLYSKELHKYFDFYHMKPLKILSIEEQIYCVSMMLHLDFNESKIKDFLRICNKYLLSNINDPVILFNTLYPRLFYYKDNKLIKDAISNIESCLINMLDCSKEEYSDWEELMSTELSDALDNIPKDYTYELVLAKSMSSSYNSKS